MMAFPMLNPTFSVQALSLICAFVLRVTVGYAVCATIARIATSAAFRFLVWLAFLLTAAVYWVYSVSRLMFPAQGAIELSSHVAKAALPTVVLSDRTLYSLGILLSAAGALYCVVLVWVTGANLWRRMKLACVLRNRVKAPQFLSQSLDEVRAGKSGPSCSIWLLPGLHSPAALGILRPGIYLPPEEAEPGNDLCNVLCHEYAHLRRRDSLWEQLAGFCRWFVLFHPFVHKALSSMRLERELACDALVVRRDPEKRAAYADTLVRFGWKELLDDSREVGIGFTSTSSALNVRVALILAGDRVYSRWSRGLRALVGSGACWLYVMLAPALWIVFTLAARPFEGVTTLPVVAVEHKRTHRKVTSSGSKLSVGDAITFPLNALSADIAPSAHSESERRPAFHIQNAEEPMSNPVVVDDGELSQSGQQRLPTNKPPFGGTRPSMSASPSILMNNPTPTASSQGSGHGHDRD